MANDDTKRLQTQAVRALQAEDGKKAMAEYEAKAIAMRANTERLKALRLAREATEGANAAASPKASKAKSGKAKTAKSPTAKTSAGKTPASKAKKGAPANLAAWVKSQEDGGHKF